MGMFDGLLNQIGSKVDVKGLAEKVGLSPDQVEQAVGALGQAHTAPGDTIETAADRTNLPQDKLQAIVTQIGGEGALARFAGLLGAEGGAQGLMGKVSGMLDRDGDGNPLNDLGGFAKGLFGKS